MNNAISYDTISKCPSCGGIYSHSPTCDKEINPIDLRSYYKQRLHGISAENIDKVPLYKLQQWDNELHGAV